MSKKITIIVYILSILSLAIGLALLVYKCTNGQYVFNKAQVIEIQGDILKVEAGSQYGDPIIYEIKKPFYKKVNNGDYINIKSKDGIIKYAVLSEDLEFIIAIILPNIALLCLYILICFTGTHNKKINRLRKWNRWKKIKLI